MIHITPIKRQILEALVRAHEEHPSTYHIAADLDEPLFRIRAELIDLARWGLVRQSTSRRLGLTWALTDVGERIHWGEQLELDT